MLYVEGIVRIKDAMCRRDGANVTLTLFFLLSPSNDALSRESHARRCTQRAISNKEIRNRQANVS